MRIRALILLAAVVSPSLLLAGSQDIIIPESEESVYRYVEMVSKQAGIPIDIDARSFQRLGLDETLDKFHEPVPFSATGTVKQVLEQLVEIWQSDHLITIQQSETLSGGRIVISAIPEVLRYLARDARWLTVDEAKRLVSQTDEKGELEWDGCLDACVELSPEVAKILATFKDDLCLRSLEDLSVAAAVALAQHGSRHMSRRTVSGEFRVPLERHGKPFLGTPVYPGALFGGLSQEEWEALSDEEKIAQQASAASWYELTCRYPVRCRTQRDKLSPEWPAVPWPMEIANAVTLFSDVLTGTLCLPKVKTLSPGVADALSKYRGTYLHLDSVDNLSAGAAQALAACPAGVSLSEETTEHLSNLWAVLGTTSYADIVERVTANWTESAEGAVRGATLSPEDETRVIKVLTYRNGGGPF